MESYNIFYLEQAKNDLKEIAAYIADELKNPTAAEKLIDKIIAAAKNLETFPYANTVFIPLQPLKHEYRKVVVDNFMLFYRIDEHKKEVSVSRMIYARRHLTKQLK